MDMIEVAIKLFPSIETPSPNSRVRTEVRLSFDMKQRGQQKLQLHVPVLLQVIDDGPIVDDRKD